MSESGADLIRRRTAKRTERILRAVDGGTDRARKAWLSYEAHALPIMESASALTSAKIDLLPHQVVLTHRIAYLIGVLGVRPYNIMAVTFTNKAAREMEQRVVDLLGENTRGLMLGTFHSTCARLLRREAEHLPFESNFVIYDSDDQVAAIPSGIGATVRYP